MLSAFDTSKPGQSPSFFDGDSEDDGSDISGFGGDHIGVRYADPSDWEECKDDEGNVFWYQISTEHSTWDAPLFRPS